eukprot:CAMPEP_0194258256 /NCGR_PEP_ID=MMETSP0158-20130606/40895_1 /TAXON_ID=33649 /ORGANISM="Thalassionema nitzschioides, Strain L26-B" /LENGTH=586 /DNA_ID=CAMNT_0038997603 /DNA_START=67 /DNA_END=1827 /DNA_ORIENTATION=-
MTEEEKKKERKERRKAEAAKLGISTKELKEREKKNKSKKREANTLESSDHKEDMKRMRTWSQGDEKDNTSSDDTANIANKRRRTRSMDAKEEQAAKIETTMSPAEWRKDQHITIRGHGKYAGRDTEFPDPFMKFSDAPFSQSVLRAFEQEGFTSPTCIQSQSWPIALRNDDMICIAKTGSGKTCGFLLPTLHQHVQTNGGATRGPRKPVLLVLAPTRELAVQIMDETKKFGRPFGVSSLCCYGGAPKYPQIAQLQRGVDCIIATPGRINDLLEMRKADLSHVKYLVLDEADRMLDMGFEPQIRSVIEKIPKERQTLLFSATWPKEIQRLAFDFLSDPIQVNVGEVGVLNANKDIRQHIHMITEDGKHDQLSKILKELTGEDSENPQDTSGAGKGQHPKVIIFTARKISCHELANQLWNDGFAVDSLHGDRPQWERTKVINAFKGGMLRMLIATDVAARGLDVKDVGAVINYDMPAGTNAVEDYVHRIGRTGRAGQKGIAHTFFTGKDRKCATQLVEVMRKAEQEIPDALQAMARPRFGGGGRGRGGGRSYGYSGGRGGRGYMSGGGGRGGGGGGRRFGGGRGRGRW